MPAFVCQPSQVRAGIDFHQFELLSESEGEEEEQEEEGEGGGPRKQQGTATSAGPAHSFQARRSLERVEEAAAEEEEAAAEAAAGEAGAAAVIEAQQPAPPTQLTQSVTTPDATALVVVASSIGSPGSTPRAAASPRAKGSGKVSWLASLASPLAVALVLRTGLQMGFRPGRACSLCAIACQLPHPSPSPALLPCPSAVQAHPRLHHGTHPQGPAGTAAQQQDHQGGGAGGGPGGAPRLPLLLQVRGKHICFTTNQPERMAQPTVVLLLLLCTLAIACSLLLQACPAAYWHLRRRKARVRQECFSGPLCRADRAVYLAGTCLPGWRLPALLSLTLPPRSWSPYLLLPTLVLALAMVERGLQVRLL